MRQIANSKDRIAEVEGEAGHGEVVKRKPLKRREITPEMSIRYMESDGTFSDYCLMYFQFCLMRRYFPGFRNTYGNELIWTHYRRNFKGGYAGNTRKTCVVS